MEVGLHQLHTSCSRDRTKAFCQFYLERKNQTDDNEVGGKILYANSANGSRVAASPCDTKLSSPDKTRRSGEDILSPVTNVISSIL